VKITIYAIGKLKEKHWQMAAQEYEKRLRRYISYHLIEIKDVKPSNKPAALIRAEESGQVQRRIPSRAMTIAMDKSGKSLSSEQLAHFLKEKSLYSAPEIAFCIGSPLGFSNEFLQNAAHVFSLSSLTFPHELARVILLEQLYRALTIINSEKYHK
jgi:23S rRNA (pseudouridine1915-N3)-methyltransferase